MTAFPNITEPQVAIMHSDAKTGDVLCSKYLPFTDSDQQLYMVFESLDAALKYIQKEVRPLRNVEAIVYNHKKDVVHYFNPLEPSRN